MKVDPEWLEEKLAKTLEEVDKLKSIIEDLLPTTDDNYCIMCKREGEPFTKMHSDGSICLWHTYYDEARKAIGFS